MTDIPITDEKPACPCGSHLVFIIDRSERGLDFWQCMTCGNEMVTRRPARPVNFKRKITPLWRDTSPN